MTVAAFLVVATTLLLLQPIAAQPTYIDAPARYYAHGLEQGTTLVRGLAIFSSYISPQIGFRYHMMADVSFLVGDPPVSYAWFSANGTRVFSSCEYLEAPASLYVKATCWSPNFLNDVPQAAFGGVRLVMASGVTSAGTVAANCGTLTRSMTSTATCRVFYFDIVELAATSYYASIWPGGRGTAGTPTPSSVPSPGNIFGLGIGVVRKVSPSTHDFAMIYFLANDAGSGSNQVVNNTIEAAAWPNSATPPATLDMAANTRRDATGTLVVIYGASDGGALNSATLNAAGYYMFMHANAPYLSDARGQLMQNNGTSGLDVTYTPYTSITLPSPTPSSTPAPSTHPRYANVRWNTNYAVLVPVAGCATTLRAVLTLAWRVDGVNWGVSLGNSLTYSALTFRKIADDSAVFSYGGNANAAAVSGSAFWPAGSPPVAAPTELYVRFDTAACASGAIKGPVLATTNAGNSIAWVGSMDRLQVSTVTSTDSGVGEAVVWQISAGNYGYAAAWYLSSSQNRAALLRGPALIGSECCAGLLTGTTLGATAGLNIEFVSGTVNSGPPFGQFDNELEYVTVVAQDGTEHLRGQLRRNPGLPPPASFTTSASASAPPASPTPSNTASSSASATLSAVFASPSPSFGLSNTPTKSPAAIPSQSPTSGAAASPSPSPSPSSVVQSVTPTGSITQSLNPTQTSAATGTPSVSPVLSRSPGASPTGTPAVSGTGTSSATPSLSMGAPPSVSPTRSAAPASGTPTGTLSQGASPSPSGTPAVSQGLPNSPSVSPSRQIQSVTPSSTPSLSVGAPASSSATPTPSVFPGFLPPFFGWYVKTPGFGASAPLFALALMNPDFVPAGTPVSGVTTLELHVFGGSRIVQKVELIDTIQGTVHMALFDGADTPAGYLTYNVALNRTLAELTLRLTGVSGVTFGAFRRVSCDQWTGLATGDSHNPVVSTPAMGAALVTDAANYSAGYGGFASAPIGAFTFNAAATWPVVAPVRVDVSADFAASGTSASVVDKPLANPGAAATAELALELWYMEMADTLRAQLRRAPECLAVSPVPTPTPTPAVFTPSSSSQPSSGLSASPSPTAALSIGASPSPSPTAALSFGASPSETPTASLPLGASPSGTPTAPLSFGASPSNTPNAVAPSKSPKAGKVFTVTAKLDTAQIAGAGNQTAQQICDQFASRVISSLDASVDQSGLLYECGVDINAGTIDVTFSTPIKATADAIFQAIDKDATLQSQFGVSDVSRTGGGGGGGGGGLSPGAIAAIVICTVCCCCVLLLIAVVIIVAVVIMTNAGGAGEVWSSATAANPLWSRGSQD